MTYDNLGRQTVRQYADNTRVTLAYDAVGNQTTMQDSTGTTTMAFDSVNRTTARTDPGLLVQGYTYDSAGQRTKLVDPDSGVRTYLFDLDGRLTTQVAGGAIVSRIFDSAGRLVSLSQSTPAFAAHWTYDAANQLVSVQRTVAGSETYRQTLTYDPVGNRTVQVLRNGVLSTYSYDAKNRLTQDNTTGTNAHVYNYSYDSTDNILTNNESGTVTTNTYDLASRLTTTLAGTTLTTYSFDAKTETT